MPVAKQTCFVIMPFSDTTNHKEAYWKDHFFNFLKPLIEDNTLVEARRSDPLHGDVVGQILADLKNNPIVVADFTDHNPNVFWEMGVRHTLRNGTILIAEEGTPMPFDVKPITALFYHPRDYIKNQDFIAHFKKAIADCIQNPNQTDSPVIAAFGKTTLLGIIERERCAAKLGALQSELQENRKALGQIHTQAKKNLKDPKGEFLAAYVRILALEHLVVDRYIEQALELYETAEAYLDNIVKINEMLDEWSFKTSAVDRYLAKTIPIALDNLSDLDGLVIEAKEKLS
jgi:hypothetical protein